MKPELTQLMSMQNISPSEVHILRRIASGGVSDLWLARHASIPVEFILKYSKISAANNPYLYGQFEREYEASQAMVNKHIENCTTCVFHFNIDSLEHPYCFIEYFPAHSLETLRPTLNDWNIIKLIFQKFTRQLSTIHKAGIIHRDIKPGNIIMNAAGETRIIDFALSTIDGNWHRFHQEGIAFGTPLYMSPEQAFGKKILLTSACDWYSVGVMLFEWMTGTHPFSGKTSKDTLKMHCYEEPPFPVNKCIQNAPQELPQLCYDLLVKEPNARYSAIRRFKDFLSSGN